MRLLFITYDFYPSFGANSYIIYNLSQFFIEMGHEVHVLPLKSAPDLKVEEIWNDIKIHRITNSYDKQQVKEYLHQRKLLSVFNLVASLLADLYTKEEYKKSQWSYYSLSLFDRIMNQLHIDTVINVCYPFESCLPIMKYIKQKGKNFNWVIYMQDPFASNYYYADKYPKEDLLEFQTEVFQSADRIVVTPAIMKEITENRPPIPPQKFKVLNFPMIKKPYRTQARDDVRFNRHYINCVYVGKFNRETRNPNLLFKLFEQLQEDYIRLHIIGEDAETWKEYLSKENTNIFFHGMRSKGAAINAELNANILVNIGNSMNNQLPSKLLEYISMGKPIFNLYKIEDCPTLDYTWKYPYCYELQENRIDAKTYRRLRRFCIECRNINLKYDYISRKYYECTVDYVSYEFLKLLYDTCKTINK